MVIKYLKGHVVGFFTRIQTVNQVGQIVCEIETKNPKNVRFFLKTNFDFENTLKLKYLIFFQTNSKSNLLLCALINFKAQNFFRHYEKLFKINKS